MESLTVVDSLYGSFVISEPVLLELINSQAVQRLRGIAQHGLPPEFDQFKGFSRYDHSVGVMLILRKLGASLEEQVAGLIHDVSHLAFSHMVDWMKERSSFEDHQDNQHKKFILNTEIPHILSKYDLDINKILDSGNYILLENELPNVCADRLDYSLRLMNGWEKSENVFLVVSSLRASPQGMFFENIKSAQIFASDYLKCQTEYWGQPLHVVAYYVFSKLLNIALKKNITAWDDFNKTDKEIMEKVYQFEDKEFKEIIKILLGQDRLKFNESEKEKILSPKLRYVDPLFLENGQLINLSGVDKTFKENLNLVIKNNSQGIKLGDFEGQYLPIYQY